jgi:hypothetical protein
MLELRGLLTEIVENADQEVRILLLTSGVAVQRRVALSTMDGEEYSDLNVTLALLFMLQVLCDYTVRTASPITCPPRPPISPSLLQHPPSDVVAGKEEENMAVDDEIGTSDASDAPDAPPVCVPDAPPVCVPDAPPDAIGLWNDSTLRESVLLERGRDKKNGAQWDTALRLTPEVVSRAALAKVPQLGAEGTLAKLTALATTFFRSSALAMQYSLLLGSAQPNDDTRSFLTLGTVDFLPQVDGDMREKRLAAIVDAAESESGQQVRILYSNSIHFMHANPYFPPGAHSATSMSFHSSPSSPCWSALTISALTARADTSRPHP